MIVENLKNNQGKILNSMTLKKLILVPAAKVEPTGNQKGKDPGVGEILLELLDCVIKQDILFTLYVQA